MQRKENFQLEMPGIEPGAFHMQSERATTALHPLIRDRTTQCRLEAKCAMKDGICDNILSHKLHYVSFYVQYY